MAEATTVRLDDQLCFALYAAVNSVTRSYRPLLRDIGLTYPQYLVMMVLWQQDSQSVNCIAERLHLGGNAVTPLLVRLEQLGHVTRTRETADARVVIVRLTVAGRDLERAAAVVQRHVVCQTGLDDVALADLRTRLHGLIDDMRAPAACASALEGEPS